MFNILKTNGNLNFVFIVNCKKDHDSLKEINENLIKDLKIHQGNNVHLGTVDLKLSNIQIISITSFHIHHKQLFNYHPIITIIQFLLSLMDFLLYIIANSLTFEGISK